MMIRFVEYYFTIRNDFMVAKNEWTKTKCFDARNILL